MTAFSAPSAVPAHTLVSPASRSLYLLALQPPASFLRPSPAAPHLPLADFWEVARFSAPPSMEATLERWLQRLLGQERGFVLRWQVADTVRLRQPNALRELALRIQTLQPFLESCGGSAVDFGFRPGRVGLAGGGRPGAAEGELAVRALYLLRQSDSGQLEQVAVLGLRP